MSRVVFRGVNITSEDILSAAATFDQLYADSIVYDAGSGHKQSSYVVRIDGRDYPPKAILALAARLPSHPTATDDTTRHVLTLLGFPIAEAIGPRRHKALPPKELAERHSAERLLETSKWIEQNHDSWRSMLDIFREASHDAKNVSVQTRNDNLSDVISSVPLTYQLLETLDLPADTKDALRSVGIRILMDLVESRDDHLLHVLNSEQVSYVRAKQAEWLLQLTQPAERLQVADGATPLTELGLSVRAYNALVRRDIRTIEQLVSMSPLGILDIRNLGTKSFDEILDSIAKYPVKYQFGLTVPALPTEMPIDKERLQQVDEPQLEPDGQAVSISALGLSVRARNALTRNNILTVGRLARMSDDDILKIHNIGQNSASEISEKLTTFLEEHPLQPIRPLLDRELLSRAMDTRWMEISITRLAFSSEINRLLRSESVRSIGDLSTRTEADFTGSTPEVIREQASRYLEWLFVQDENVWNDEIANRGISPLYRLGLEKIDFDALLADWFSRQPDREKYVLGRRYGLDGRVFTLEEVGQEMGITRERVRQIEKKAVATLSNPSRRQQMLPVAETLRQIIENHGGVLRPRSVFAFVREAYGLELGGVDPLGVLRLVAGVYGEIVVSERQKIVYLSSCSPDTIYAVQMEMVRILDDRAMPLSTRALLKRFKQTAYYLEHLEELPDAFVTACLRSSNRIERTDKGLHGLKRASWKRKSTVFRVMREIGEPAHFSVITQHFNSMTPINRQLSEHNLHAYLGRFPEQFVRVGHGVYGLVEWGLRNDGKVANTAYKVLQDAGRPFHIDALTQEVLKNWHVNPGSVLAAVETDDRFIRIGRGVYALKEHVSGETNPDTQFDFGQVFGEKLVRWQEEVDQHKPSISFDAQGEIETVRSLGTDFFSG